MASSVDPNEVRLTGENSFIRLAQQDGGPFTSRASHWRVWLSPVGPGHVLFLDSELTGGETRVYADNIALARWLQEEIESNLNPPNGDLSLPVAEASFSRGGDIRSFWIEDVYAGDSEISLTWYDFGEPYVWTIAPGTVPLTGPHGVYTLFIPARRARLVVDGEQALGQPLPMERDGRLGSTASLALAETWLRPR